MDGDGAGGVRAVYTHINSEAQTQLPLGTVCVNGHNTPPPRPSAYSTHTFIHKQGIYYMPRYSYTREPTELCSL